MIICNVDRSKRPRLVVWMRDAEWTDPHLDATHQAPCRCGAGYTKGPTLDEVAKLHEQMRWPT